MDIYLCTPHTYPHIFDEMDIYLAGAGTGNNNYLWKKHKTGTCSRPYVIDKKDKIHVLESFYYMDDWMLPYIKDHWNFMLDSGAFTFFSGNGNIDWKEYTKRYCKFINENNIDLFFELDIEKITSLNYVEDLRKYIEDQTGKQSIPVWRPFRGIEYWYKMIEEYNYVAISASGAYDSGWTRKIDNEKILNKLCFEAKKKGCKVHGLGYTSLEGLTRVKFDSVDSTAWIYGNRGGYLYRFNGRTIEKINKPEGTRLNSKKSAIHNFKEWVKFQKYAEKYL